MKRPRVLFWTQGDVGRGLGLVVRMLVLAGKLKSRAEILFFVNSNRHAVTKVRDAGFRLRRFPTVDALDGKERALRAFRPDLVVTDIKKPEDRFFRRVKDLTGARIATFDELNRVKLHSDIVINYNTFDPKRRFRSTLSGTRFLFGPRYAILRDEFSRGRRPSAPRALCRRLMVAFGGSDPMAMTPKVAAALRLVKRPITADFVLGAAFPFDRELETALRGASYPYRVRRDVKNMAELLRRADLVITAGGTIMYEALYLRRPALTIALAAHQDEFARQLARRGAVRHLGMGDRLTPARIAREVERLARDAPARRALARAGSGIIDGRGAGRLAAELDKLLERKGTR